MSVAAGALKPELELPATTTRIVATSTALVPLAALLADDILAVSGVRLNFSAVAAASATGDISLSFGAPPTAADVADWGPAREARPIAQRSAAAMNDAEWYTLVVDGHGAAITCANYTGCAWGVSTLLQTLCVSGVVRQEIALPAMAIEDRPDVPYRAVCGSVSIPPGHPLRCLRPALVLTPY